VGDSQFPPSAVSGNTLDVVWCDDRAVQLRLAGYGRLGDGYGLESSVFPLRVAPMVRSIFATRYGAGQAVAVNQDLTSHFGKECCNFDGVETDLAFAGLSSRQGVMIAVR
jgi:hypothetical protein